ncbi:MAG TPA: HAMP domain-containing sensor histidine kinase [Gemmatimonadaceae bacterium]|nr:HAMP domain-containing sensor histidine kinase [Gemmatimonadaceae bacterium]
MARLSERAAQHSAPGAWLPFGFVIVALVLLLATPIITSRVVGRIRTHVFDVADEARILISSFETSFTQELLADGVGASPSAARDSARGAAIAAEQAALRKLSPVVGRLGGAAVEEFVDLRTAVQAWRAAEPVRRLSQGSSQAQDRARQDAQNVIAAAEALYGHLIGISNNARERVRRLDRIELVSSAILSTLALAAVGVLVALERKLRRFANEADDRAQKLERSVELRATLIQGVVHDVKNPLNAASGYAELMEEGIVGPMNPKQTEMLGRFKRLVATALKTVSEFVELARVDSHEYPIERRNTNLVTAAREIVEDHRPNAMQKDIALTFESPTRAVMLNTDPVRIRHVVENLVTNAIKYTPEHGAVRVSVEPDGDHVHVTVQDTGPGIPVELRERIFDPFFRVPSTEETPGTGLGLAISRRIARLLGGDVTVRDAPEHGAIFALALPLRTAS